jgi:uncharacterized Zn finger protein (UPF0148 family)
MSKVRCEYCEAVFEYKGQPNCPSCAASLGNNAQVKAILEEEERRKTEAEAARDLFRQQAEETFQRNMETHSRMSRFVTIFIIVVAAMVLLGFITTFLGVFSFRNWFF